MGLGRWLTDAVNSVSKALSGRKRKAPEEEDEEQGLPPPVPESASRPHHPPPAVDMDEDVEEPAPPAQQPHGAPGNSRGPAQRLDFSSPAVNGVPRRVPPGGAAGQRPQQRRLPFAGSASSRLQTTSQPGEAAAAPADGTAGDGQPPADQPFARRFAPPQAPRATPPARAVHSAFLSSSLRQVVEAPPSLTKMALTPATARYQQQAQQGQAARVAAPQQPLGLVHGLFTGSRAAMDPSRRQRPQPLFSGPTVPRPRGIELQPMFAAHAFSAGDAVRPADAEVLRQAVQRRLVEEERHQHELEQRQQQAQPPAGPSVEEVDLTGEPSSSQQQQQQQEQQPGQQQGRAAWPPPQALGAAPGAAPARSFDWREMLQRLAGEQDGLSDLDSDLGPAPAPPPPMDDTYLQLVAQADLARLKALQAQEQGVQFAQQAHTALEKAQPQRAEALEEEALQIQRQLHDLQLQRRQAEARRALQQQTQPPAAAAQLGAAAAKAAETEEEEQAEVVDLLSSDEEEAAQESVSASEEEEEEEEQEARAQLKAVALKDLLARPAAVPDEWREEYDSALAPGPPGEVLVSHKRSSIDISRKDITCMAHMQWLNDEVINLYISLLQERDTARREQDLGPRCHFFSTFFANKLYKDGGYNYNEVRRWTLPKRLAAAGQASASILDCDRVVLPVHQGLHWVCAVIDLQRQRFIYYDSLKGEDHRCLDHLAHYLKDEFKNKRGEERADVLGWPREFPKDIPQQHNGCDCGVFTLLFASYAGRAAPMAFSQADIDDFRVRIVHELLALRVD